MIRLMWLCSHGNRSVQKGDVIVSGETSISFPPCSLFLSRPSEWQSHPIFTFSLSHVCHSLSASSFCLTLFPPPPLFVLFLWISKLLKADCCLFFLFYFHYSAEDRQTDKDAEMDRRLYRSDVWQVNWHSLFFFGFLPSPFVHCQLEAYIVTTCLS